MRSGRRAGPTLWSALQLILAVGQTLGLVRFGFLLAVAATLFVPESGLQNALVHNPITANHLKPPECASLNLVNIVQGSGVINGTGDNDLILGSAAADDIDGGEGDDCILGGGGDDILHGGFGGRSGTVRDEFNAVSFSNDDGTLSWSGNWLEVGEGDGAAAGDVNVEVSMGRGLYVAYADQDSWLEERNPNTNRGTETTLKVKPHTGDQRRAVFRFNLMAVPAGANVVKAMAYFYVTNNNGTPVDVHRITDSWTEGGVTWSNTAADYDPTVTGTFTPATNGQYVGVDVTALVQAWVNGTTPNQGLMLVARAGAAETWYSSREVAGTTQDPYLAIDVSAGGGVNTLMADQDSWIDRTRPGDNYGAVTELKTRLLVGGGFRSLYRFDLSTLPVGASVVRATAYFWVTVADGNPVNVHRVTDTWTEMGVTWDNTAGDFDPLVEGTFTPSTSGQFVAVDISSLVQKWVNGTAPNYGLMFIGTVNDRESRYRSREQGGTSQDPYLEVVLARNGPAQALRIQNGSRAAWRVADLAGAATAELRFAYRQDGLDDAGDYVAVEVSANGGGSWTELARFQGPATDAGMSLVVYDISSYIATNTAVRFISSPNLGKEDRVYFDNVHINIIGGGSGDGGNDILLGGDGNDTLIGGDGYDICTGGPGSNTYDSSCEVQN